jgi:hypothetical protein
MHWVLMDSKEGLPGIDIDPYLLAPGRINFAALARCCVNVRLRKFVQHSHFSAAETFNRSLARFYHHLPD